MKVEAKLSLLFAFVLVIIGVVFVFTGFSVVNVLKAPFNMRGPIPAIIIFIGLIGLLIFIGFSIDRKIRKPLFFFIRWIDQLSDGVFHRPKPIKNFTPEKMKFSPFLELQEKLDGLTNQLTIAEKERAELEETRRNWTSGVTHDLKTPLSYIKGYAAMLNSDHQWNEADIKEFSKIIEEKSIYMEQLIDDLSVVYEFDKMQIPLQLEANDVVAFVDDVLEDCRHYPVASDYSIQLAVKHEGSILLSFNQTLLKRALENFIMNAIDHNPKATTIIVSIEASINSTCIVIQDDGIGMDDKTMQQLFHQYYRGTTTDKSHLGSGLGMSIAKQFIEKQGGQIEVQSKLNEGTTIKLLFPSKN